MNTVAKSKGFGLVSGLEYYISAPLIRVGPPGYFTHIPITTPIVSALKNYYI
jgi:hypothetical protein